MEQLISKGHDALHVIYAQCRTSDFCFPCHNHNLQFVQGQPKNYRILRHGNPATGRPSYPLRIGDKGTPPIPIVYFKLTSTEPMDQPLITARLAHTNCIQRGSKDVDGRRCMSLKRPRFLDHCSAQLDDMNMQDMLAKAHAASHTHSPQQLGQPMCI